MAEYLNREDVLSNADIITVQTREYGNIDVVPVEYLADLPTADVEEVVRCKDCKWGEKYVIDNDTFLYKCRKMSIGGFAEDFYCGYGERRTDDD